MTWTPPPELVDDARRALALAPRGGPRARFEAWAWPALLDHVGAGLLTRAAQPAHLTASAVVLTPDAARTCLVLHTRLGRWVQPGGHLEPGDRTLCAAAAREVAEETGLSPHPRQPGDDIPLMLSRHRAPCRPDVVDWHLDVQYLLVAEPVTPRASVESRDVAWWPIEALPDLLAPGVAATVAAAVARIRLAPSP